MNVFLKTCLLINPELVLSGLVVVFFIFLVQKWQHSYWKRQNIPQLKPKFFYGDQEKAWKGHCSKTELFKDIYTEFKNQNRKFGGFYMLWKPLFMPVDPTIIKDLLKTDFNHFQDHGLYHHHRDVLFENIFTLEGERWNRLRKILGPVFRPSNIKSMTEFLIQNSIMLNTILYDQYVKPNNPVNINKLLDDLVNSTYGFEPDILKNNNKNSKTFGSYIFKPRKYWFILEQIIPWPILGYFGHKASNGNELEKRFMRTFYDYLKNKPKDNNQSFMSIFLNEIKMKNTSENTNATEYLSTNSFDMSRFKLSKDEIISHSFLFLASGFETAATSATFVFHDLALNLDIQAKVREEIREILFKYDNKLSFNAVQEMSYLDKVIKESLRHHPPFARIARICTSDYKIPNTNVIIKKGTKTIIPMWGLHMDEQYFPNPEKFNPEHFTKENIENRPECTWFPFGEGKRVCLGQKLAMLQMKVAVAALLKDYEFSINKERTILPIKMTAFTIISKIKGDLWLNATKV